MIVQQIQSVRFAAFKRKVAEQTLTETVDRSDFSLIKIQIGKSQLMNNFLFDILFGAGNALGGILLLFGFQSGPYQIRSSVILF